MMQSVMSLNNTEFKAIICGYTFIIICLLYRHGPNMYVFISYEAICIYSYGAICIFLLGHIMYSHGAICVH